MPKARQSRSTSRSTRGRHASAPSRERVEPIFFIRKIREYIQGIHLVALVGCTAPTPMAEGTMRGSD